MRDFRNYQVWEKAHKLTQKIYKITLLYPREEQYGIISQIRRASYSIPSNLAEGCGRDSDNEFNRFIQIATGSANELEYFIILSGDLHYIDNNLANEIIADIQEIKKNVDETEIKNKIR